MHRRVLVPRVSLRPETVASARIQLDLPSSCAGKPHVSVSLLFFSFRNRCDNSTFGGGKLATAGKNVKICYEGCFPDGRVFDKNNNRRRPLQFRVGEPEQALDGVRACVYLQGNVIHWCNLWARSTATGYLIETSG